MARAASHVSAALQALESAALRAEFLEQLGAVRRSVFARVRPKQLFGQPLTGPMLVDLLNDYVSPSAQSTQSTP